MYTSNHMSLGKYILLYFNLIIYQFGYLHNRMNEACMVKIKDKWYRAVHEENKNEFYRLHLIDYAVEVCASYKDIRKMPFKLYRQPNYLFDASIDGICLNYKKHSFLIISFIHFRSTTYIR